MKLTETQNYILEKAYKEIDFARTHTIIEWATSEKLGCENIEDTRTVRKWKEYGYNSSEEALNSLRKTVEAYAEACSKYYENAKNGIVITTANSGTLKALEKLQLIEIITNGKSYPDTIKVLNY